MATAIVDNLELEGASSGVALFLIASGACHQSVQHLDMASLLNLQQSHPGKHSATAIILVEFH